MGSKRQFNGEREYHAIKLYRERITRTLPVISGPTGLRRDNDQSKRPHPFHRCRRSTSSFRNPPAHSHHTQLIQTVDRNLRPGEGASHLADRNKDTHLSRLMRPHHSNMAIRLNKRDLKWATDVLLPAAAPNRDLSVVGRTRMTWQILHATTESPLIHPGTPAQVSLLSQL